MNKHTGYRRKTHTDAIPTRVIKNNKKGFSFKHLSMQLKPSAVKKRKIRNSGSYNNNVTKNWMQQKIHR